MNCLSVRWAMRIQTVFTATKLFALVTIILTGVCYLIAGKRFLGDSICLVRILCFFFVFRTYGELSELVRGELRRYADRVEFLFGFVCVWRVEFLEFRYGGATGSVQVGFFFVKRDEFKWWNRVKITYE